MNMAEYIQALENYVASRKLNLGDGESILSLLYEAYGNINQMYDDLIKADFAELYQALNGMPLQETGSSIPSAPSAGIMNEMDLCAGFWWACDCHKKHRVQNNLYT